MVLFTLLKKVHAKAQTVVFQKEVGLNSTKQHKMLNLSWVVLKETLTVHYILISEGNSVKLISKKILAFIWKKFRSELQKLEVRKK